SCRHVVAVCLLALVLGIPAVAAPGDAGGVAAPMVEVLGEHATEGVRLLVSRPELKQHFAGRVPAAVRAKVLEADLQDGDQGR
ncbi:MAG TPA: hypothetical protein VE153_36915, partial [Myxococcus sp.]|nr:hypothetical protein [Myxococcus sp.]